MSNVKKDADCLACNSITYFESIIELLNRISLSYDKNDVPLLIEAYDDISYNLIENFEKIDYELFQTIMENQKEEYYDVLKKYFIKFLNYTILLLEKEKKRLKKNKKN